MKYVRRGTPDDALDAFKRTDVPKGHKRYRQTVQPTPLNKLDKPTEVTVIVPHSDEARGPDVLKTTESQTINSKSSQYARGEAPKSRKKKAEK